MSDQKFNQFNTPEEPEQEWIREFGPVTEETLPTNPEEQLEQQLAEDEAEVWPMENDEPTGVLHWTGPTRGQ